MPTVSQASLFEEPLSEGLPLKIGSASVGLSSIRSVLTPGRGSTADYDFTLNAYRGCTFGCQYCYAPSFESRPELSASWGTWVEVKDRALEALVGIDLTNKSIFMSSVTDPYQPIEAKLRLTQRIVERLADAQARLTVQTRSPIVTRDMDLLKTFQFARVNVSIPTDSDAVRRKYEPSAPSIEARLRTVAKLKGRGIQVSVCISPMLPLQDPRRFAQLLNDSGADMVVTTWFHQSQRPFTATTGIAGLAQNRENGWTESEFLRNREILRRHCRAWSSSRSAFGPPGPAVQQGTKVNLA